MNTWVCVDAELCVLGPVSAVQECVCVCVRLEILANQIRAAAAPL